MVGTSAAGAQPAQHALVGSAQTGSGRRHPVKLSPAGDAAAAGTSAAEAPDAWPAQHALGGLAAQTGSGLSAAAGAPGDVWPPLFTPVDPERAVLLAEAAATHASAVPSRQMDGAAGIAPDVSAPSRELHSGEAARNGAGCGAPDAGGSAAEAEYDPTAAIRTRKKGKPYQEVRQGSQAPAFPPEQPNFRACLRAVWREQGVRMSPAYPPPGRLSLYIHAHLPASHLLMLSNILRER